MPTAQSVMLAIHCKKTDPVELKTPLLTYIRSTYSDREADEAADDLQLIQGLRVEVMNAQANAPNVRETLSRYYRCLVSIETRFPIGKEKGQAQVSFGWYDAFRPARKVAQNNIHFEKAAVLFNLAALSSQQALASDRTSGEGLTQACKLFQEAAGLFQYLREQVATKTESPRPLDMSSECSGLLEKLMLTQAQECVYHKAVIDKRTPTVLVRLAKQVGVMYEDVERCFGAAALANYFDKSWAQHVQLKASTYQVEELIQYSRQQRADDKVNNEIAILKEAFLRLQTTRKYAKAINQDMAESVARTQELVQSLLAKAEKDNGSIYLMKVPAFADLPANTGALLVKAVPPANLDATAEAGLFSGLIPDSSAKALSKYSDMVDAAVRQQRDKLAAATDNARVKLKEWELPDMLEALDARTGNAAGLPDGVRHELEEIEAIGGVTHLKGILAEIGELRREVEDDLAAAQTCLDNDSRADGEARAKHGDKYRAQAAATAAKPYWDRVQQYRASLQKAGDSDQGVLRRLADNEGAFAKLTQEAAANAMPRLQAPMLNTGPDDPAVVVATLRRNLDALQALAAERSGMEEALKELKAKDNVLPKLMATAPQGYDALFAAEIKKYDGIAADVAKNVASQDALLAGTAQANAAFRAIFDVQGWKQACVQAAAASKESTRLYRELLDHCSEGLRFYLGMGEVVKKAKQEASDFAFTRQVQREELLQEIDRRAQQEDADKLAARMAAANMRPGAPPPPPPAAYPSPPPGSTAAGAPPPPLQHQQQQPPQYYQQQHQHAPPPPQQSQHVPQYGAAPPPPPYYGYAPAAQPPQYGAPHQPQYGAPPPPGQPGYSYPPHAAYNQAPPPQPPPGYAPYGYNQQGYPYQQ